MRQFKVKILGKVYDLAKKSGADDLADLIGESMQNSLRLIACTLLGYVEALIAQTKNKQTDLIDYINAHYKGDKPKSDFAQDNGVKKIAK